MVLHKSKVRPNAFGGTTYTTACGRTNIRSVDGMNIADSDRMVSCKFCLRAMEITRRMRAAKEAREQSS